MPAGRIQLHTPGPTNVPDRILRAMHRPCEDFAAPEFSDTARSCLDDLRKVFRTQGTCFAFIANGHGAWEVGIVNLFEPGDCVLVPLAGRFSQSWAEMARACGLEVITTPLDLTRGIDIEKVAGILAEDKTHRIKGVLAVHTETASSCRSDLLGIRRALDACGHPALFIVDAIASLAIESFSMDEWGIDFALAASQKGLMMPPGLALVAINDRAMRIAENCRHPRLYWDLQFRRGDESYQWFHGTPPLQQIWGLRESLDIMLEEGVDEVTARHARLAGAVRAAIGHWAQAGGLGFQAARAEERAHGVTAIAVHDGDPNAMRQHTRDRYNLVLGAGLGELGGKVFRIGHMGDMNETMILGALGTVELAMRETGLTYMPGGVAAAIEALATDPA